MIIAVSLTVVVIALLYVLLIRQADLPYVEPLSPTAHLDERREAIFENIRDANFEFLMGKLSEDDYQQTKTDLQKELAEVNAEKDAVVASVAVTAQATAAPAGTRRKSPGKSLESTKGSAVPSAAQVAAALTAESISCPHCGAQFSQSMKFCGECGQPMDGVAQS